MLGATGLQVFTEYGQDSKHREKEPVRVLFDGVGHYDYLVAQNQESASKL
jgi:hypothetical protein